MTIMHPVLGNNMQSVFAATCFNNNTALSDTYSQYSLSRCFLHFIIIAMYPSIH